MLLTKQAPSELRVPRVCCWLHQGPSPHHVSVLFNVVCVAIYLCCVTSVVISMCCMAAVVLENSETTHKSLQPPP